MAANNSVIEIIGEVTLPLYLGDRRVDTVALISPDVEELMIGADWLQEHNCVWSFGSGHLSIDGQQHESMTQKGTLRCRRVYTTSDVVIPARHQVNAPARSTIATMKRKVTDNQRTYSAEATVPELTEANVTTAEMTYKQKTDPEIGAVIQLHLQQEGRQPITKIMTELEAAKALWSQWELLEVKDGRVYRRLPAKGDRPEYLQLVVPAELQKDVMRRSHTHMCAGHLGFRKTADQVQRRAYWVGWRRDVKRFCRQCDDCNRYHRGRLPKTAPLQPIVTGDVWERLSVDLTGPAYGEGCPLSSRLRGLGERRELPQRGPGRSPGRKRDIGVF